MMKYNMNKMENQIDRLDGVVTVLKGINAAGKYGNRTIESVSSEWNEKDENQRYEMMCEIPELMEQMRMVEHSKNYTEYDGADIEVFEFEEENEYGICLADYFGKYCNDNNGAKTGTAGLDDVIKNLERTTLDMRKEVAKFKREHVARLYSNNTIGEIAEIWNTGDEHLRRAMASEIPELGDKIVEVEYTAVYYRRDIPNIETYEFDEINELGIYLPGYFQKYCRKDAQTEAIQA